jgi:uncharacterized protein (DUF305 family)
MSSAPAQFERPYNGRACLPSIQPKEIAMRLRLILLTMAFLAPATGVLAEEKMDISILPQACRAGMMSADDTMTGGGAANAGAADAAAAMPSPEAAKPSASVAATDASKETVAAVNGMHDPMLAAAKIADPDLAFNCGMLVHHHGAIDMARIELKYGKDPVSRKMAEMIIEAQTKEISDMAAHIEKMTKQ